MNPYANCSDARGQASLGGGVSMAVLGADSGLGNHFLR